MKVSITARLARAALVQAAHGEDAGSKRGGLGADADRRARGGGLLQFGFGDEGSLAVGLPQDDVAGWNRGDSVWRGRRASRICTRIPRIS